MGKKKPPEPKNDFAGEEALDVCSFSEEPIITGKCIASFSFSNDSTDKINESAINISNNENTLADNRKSPIVNGCAPPIDGEYLDIKRTYMLRSSTVRKLNELKSIHPDLNTYVSTLVDLAIAHYYEHIINEDGTQ